MSDEIYRPTPTQNENDRAALGQPQMVKVPDGSPTEAERPKPTLKVDEDEPELVFHTRALEPAQRGTYRTRAYRQDAIQDDQSENDGGL